MQRVHECSIAIMELGVCMLKWLQSIGFSLVFVWLTYLRMYQKTIQALFGSHKSFRFHVAFCFKTTLGSLGKTKRSPSKCLYLFCQVVLPSCPLTSVSPFLRMHGSANWLRPRFSAVSRTDDGCRQPSAQASQTEAFAKL